MVQESSKAKIGAGDVNIKLNGEDFTLRPSYNAARTISNQAGGISGAIKRIIDMDLDTVVLVISLGLGYNNNNRAPKDLPERVWKTGLTDDTGGLLERCVTYLRVLASGGQLPKDVAEARDDSEDPPQS